MRPITFQWIVALVICATAAANWSQRPRGRRKNVVTSPLDDIVHQLDTHNYWLNNQMKKEHSTLNEAAKYSNDDHSSKKGWQHKDKHEDEKNLLYMKLALQNAKNVMDHGKCETPTQRCLNMHIMNRRGPKNYWPACALVHKCEHGSGCCKDPGHVCSPVQTHSIDLYFFSFTPQDPSIKDGRGKVERFTFENHTECACRAAGASLYVPQGIPERDNNLIPEKKSCQCPKHFIPRPDTEECLCTCNTHQTRVCKKILKGKRSYHHKGCKGGCGPPSCDYGDYKIEFGRCPRRRERKNRRK